MGGLIGARIAPDPSLITLPIAAIVVGSAWQLRPRFIDATFRAQTGIYRRKYDGGVSCTVRRFQCADK